LVAQSERFSNRQAAKQDHDQGDGGGRCLLGQIGAMVGFRTRWHCSTPLIGDRLNGRLETPSINHPARDSSATWTPHD
jgi:hypothetical protein